ncbi:hypothetical protein CMV_009840 [Castanea mollissima]|uniref:Uncharacterized protein n=1 Tax=Castanea mollissima TaxID=60419 RepID=A0A8J4RGN3_9ROSI|nr:hypothetical protein CMV_009840 [Castanea mollissima]
MVGRCRGVCVAVEAEGEGEVGEEVVVEGGDLMKGKARESEAQSDVRPRNVNWGTGGGRRGNGRRNHGFKGQDNRPYDRQSRCNNRRGEVSNDTEVMENRGGDIGTAEQVYNNAGAEWYALSTNDF